MAAVRGPRRRDVLVGAAAVGVGAAAGVAGVRLTERLTEAAPLGQQRREANDASLPPGLGVESAHAVFLGLDLAPGLERDRIASLLRLLHDDAARLTRGAAPIGDQEPELAEQPANLAVTFGFGPGLVERVNPAARPEWLAQLPAFSIDALEDHWSEGDLLLLVTGDDPLAVAHAQRMLLKDARAYTTIRWQQHGFRNAHGVAKPATTQRNLFGQLDGTSNPTPGTTEFETVVRITEPGWLQGGTSLVLRRIEMNLETWDEVDRPGREASVGRRLDTGAPLTGTHEHDEPDFEAVTPQGFTVINAASHVRRSRPDDPSQRIFRQPYNYDLPVSPAAGEDAVGGRGAQVSNSGLLFASFQANPTLQYVPIQQRLADADLLNTWTTPIGSAVFAIPPATREFPGQALFDA
ncbi:Dyp-type peroxidase [Gulosibacter sediminis]|uniref:Dyp-type peroxidase n=1 Tax=Gulosibacter sediminis TaxID=1729695 RepID=UPI001868CDA8|nr:Dyp-type peroxidase [Gulosibacter sediminis]